MPEITLYITPSCPFCRAAVQLCEQIKIPYKSIRVDNDPETRSRVSKENGNFPTVPMIFVDDAFVGGFDDFSAMVKSGKLSSK